MDGDVRKCTGYGRVDGLICPKSVGGNCQDGLVFLMAMLATYFKQLPDMMENEFTCLEWFGSHDSHSSA